MTHRPLLQAQKDKNEQIKSKDNAQFDGKGVAHKKFVPQGHSVNAAYYVDVLERLQKREDEKRDLRHLTTPSPQHPM